MKKSITKNYPNPFIFKGNVRTMPMNNISGEIPVNRVIPAGTMISAPSEDATILKTGMVYEAVTGTNVKVYKDHSFGIGDSLSGNTITGIDTSNDLYDVLTLTSSATFTLNQRLVSFNFDTASQFSVVAETVEVEEGVESFQSLSLPVSDIAILDKAKLPNYSAASFWGPGSISIINI